MKTFVNFGDSCKTAPNLILTEGKLKTAWVIFCDRSVTAVTLTLQDAKEAVEKFKKEDPTGDYFYVEKELYGKVVVIEVGK